MTDLRWKVSYTEEPNLPVRQKAYNVAKGIIAKHEEYAPPLVKAARAYARALDRGTSEEDRYRLATEFLDEIDANIEFAKQLVKVLADFERMVREAAGDHNRLAYLE